MSQSASTVVETPLATFDRTSLPNDWRWVRLKDVCNEIYRYPSFYGMEHLSQGVAVIRGEHIDSSGEISTDWSKYWFISTDVSNKFPRTMLSEGDLVFTVRGTIGKVGIVRASHVGAQISPNLIRISPSSEIQSSFLWYYLHTIKGTEEAVKDNAVTIATVRASDLIELNIPLPPLAEQKRIAAILNEQMEALERARSAAEAQLKAAKDLPAAFMRAVFDSPEAQQWTVKRLDEVCLDISDGTHFTPTYVPHGIPFLSVKDVKETGISFNNCRYITEEQHRDLCRRCKPEKGDVLYTKVGTTGIAKAIDVDREFSIFVSVALLKLKPDVLPEYMEKVLNSPLGRAQAAELTQGMANRNLVIRDIKQIEIPIPPLDIQSYIVRVLGEQLIRSEQTREQLQTQLDTINKLPAALLRQAFTGKL